MINETALRIGEKLLQNRSVSRFQLRQALALQHDTSERLGPLLTRLGYLPESRLEQIAQVVPQAPTCLRLGELLLRKAWITATQLDDALTEQRHSEEDLGTLLIRKGWLSPDRLEQALTEQLLVRAPTHRRRLGHILIQTRQLSQWQLNLALRLKQALPAAGQGPVSGSGTAGPCGPGHLRPSAQPVRHRVGRSGSCPDTTKLLRTTQYPDEGNCSLSSTL